MLKRFIRSMFHRVSVSSRVLLSLLLIIPGACFYLLYLILVDVRDDLHRRSSFLMDHVLWLCEMVHDEAFDNSG
jgi:hypothetical protein